MRGAVRIVALHSVVSEAAAILHEQISSSMPPILELMSGKSHCAVAAFVLEKVSPLHRRLGREEKQQTSETEKGLSWNFKEDVEISDGILRNGLLLCSRFWLLTAPALAAAEPIGQLMYVRSLVRSQVQ